MPSLREVQTPKFGVPKDEQYKVTQDAAIQHVGSFNYLITHGLTAVVENLSPIEILLPNEDRLSISIKSCRLMNPTIKRGVMARNFRVFPAECRGRHVSYKGSLQAAITLSLNGVIQEIIEKNIGEIPIMVKSQACNLDKLTPKQLVAVGEEENEFGGYFIINGLEKVVRLLIAQRRNYPIAMRRSGWKKRGDLFTDYGVAVRCVHKDQSGSNLVLHFLSDGTSKLMFSYMREIYLMPVIVILKALVNETDYYIYQEIIKGKENDSFFQNCIKGMLRKLAEKNIIFQHQALEYIGKMFSVKLNLPPWYTNEDVAQFLIKRCIAIHLDSPKEKFDFIVFMIQKLYLAVRNECALESPDSLMCQEVMTPGQFMLMVIKEKLMSWQTSVRMTIEKKLKSPKADITPNDLFKEGIKNPYDITRGVENVLATGNFLPRFESSLQQFSGLVAIADKLNYWRYLSHFRAVHRGAFFAQMRTTTVRKLLPEAWGFLCPVHTPDGTPCGLLNHMSSGCQVVNDIQPNKKHLFNIFCKYGLIPIDDPVPNGSRHFSVLCDGRVVGRVLEKDASNFVAKLRSLKVKQLENVPSHMEICFIPSTEAASPYSGIFIFTTPFRLIRPVNNIVYNTIEYLGTMEQVFLRVAFSAKEVIHGVTLHSEISPQNVLSILANQIPYSDLNQSPRNMYECQMGKQTMGTPCHSIKLRSDNKLYQIRTPQSPLVRPEMHDYYHMDDYPLGTNAIVAVISNTGYDMEDAIMLNKSSVERGFKHGSIYKTEVISLRVIAGDKGLAKSLVFGRGKDGEKYANFVDIDGLPYVGTRLTHGDPICCYHDKVSGISTCVKYKSTEEAYIEDVRVLGNDTGSEVNQQISVKYRVPRNPVIGDKFASRHGQKGICSILGYVEDMPFTDSGMTPDIIFNPHGFPSRMTIGMMVESMAGKSAAVNGVLHDATPFTFSEENTAFKYFGECLRTAGYDYYGTERMYSGTTGEELEVDIFFGVVYYQRLRHMVSDKYQVRTTGPVDPITRQPVKGRKREGGVRFGEMERDALISHGSDAISFDRLLSSSDISQQFLCLKCQDVLSPSSKLFEDVFSPNEWTCRICGSNQDVELVEVPFVFRYLCAELFAVNIRSNLLVGDYD